MKPPPFMFAAILLVVFLMFVAAILFSNWFTPGPHLTGNPATP